MSNETAITIIEGNFQDPSHCAAVVDLVDAYARDPMGGGTPLPVEVRRHLADGLRAHPTSLFFLAYDGSDAIGVAVCFVGYSTFAARPLINIHDIAVRPAYRRCGVGQLLLKHIEEKARALGYCKLTLEVRADNAPAQGLYRRQGFSGGDVPMLFWTKPLG